MKKKDKKVSEKRKAQNNTSLSDLGLEPPKIYRESQKKIVSKPENNNSRRKKAADRTKNEKRKVQTKKRVIKNKIRKALIWLAIIILVIAVGVVLSLTVFFNIENITVQGNERYETDEILSQCPINEGENLILANTENAQLMLEQNLPYIYNVEIKRKLPSTIALTVTETQPSFYIKNEDKSFILLDDNLKILEIKAAKKSGIEIRNASIVQANEGQKIVFEDENVSECIDKLSKTVINNNITEITAIYSNNISDNYVIYDNRISFKLGTCDELENKIYQALAACEQLDETSPNAKGTMTINGGKQLYFTEK